MKKDNILYIIKHDFNNFISYKIGITNNLQQRFGVLNTSCPGHLSVYFSLSLKENVNNLEKFIHNKFKEKKIKGEWFSLSDEEISNENIEKILFEYRNLSTKKIKSESFNSKKYIQCKIKTDDFINNNFLNKIKNFDIIDCEIYRTTARKKKLDYNSWIK